MKPPYLKELQQVNTRPENRQQLLDELRVNADFFNEVLQLISTDKKLGPKAARAIELVCLEDISIGFDAVDEIIQLAEDATQDAVIRPMAKLLECFVLEHYKKSARLQLTLQQREKICACCFDWLITDQKVAPQVYSMGTLVKLGKEMDWIYPEMVPILERNYASGSAGYKSRSRKILQKIRLNT